MANKQLVEYIKTYSAQGYSIASIRSNLLASGYTPKQIDDAVTVAFHGKAPLPWKLILLVLAGLVLLILLVYGLVLLLSPSAGTLRLSVGGAPSSLTPGQPLTFTRTVMTGVAEPIEVELSYSIINAQTRERIFTTDDRATVRTTSKKRESLTLPRDAKAGDYLLTITASGDGQTATKDVSFTYKGLPGGLEEVVTPDGETPTTPDTTPTLPGASTPSRKTCHPTCNDYDPCTLDKCVEGVCDFAAITPCCGNFECESGETEGTCAQDCKERPLTQGEAIMSIRRRAEDTATKNPGEAVTLCKSIAVQAQADSCMKSVAYASKQSDICSHISSTKLRDACYLDFALKNKQASVCAHVVDRWMKQSCVVYTNAKPGDPSF